MGVYQFHHHHLLLILLLHFDMLWAYIETNIMGVYRSLPPNYPSNSSLCLDISWAYIEAMSLAYSERH